MPSWPNLITTGKQVRIVKLASNRLQSRRVISRKHLLNPWPVISFSSSSAYILFFFLFFPANAQPVFISLPDARCVFLRLSLHVIRVDKENTSCRPKPFPPTGCRAHVFDNNQHQLQVHSITQPRCGKREKSSAKRGECWLLLLSYLFKKKKKTNFFFTLTSGQSY